MPTCWRVGAWEPQRSRGPLAFWVAASGTHGRWGSWRSRPIAVVLYWRAQTRLPDQDARGRTVPRRRAAFGPTFWKSWRGRRMATRDWHHAAEKEANTWPSEERPVFGHLLANLYLFFSGRLLAELFKEAADTGEAPG